MFLSVLNLCGGLLLAMCGVCSLAERYHRSRPRKRGMGWTSSDNDSWWSFTDTSHVLDSSTYAHDTWGWHDGSDDAWSGGGSCGGGDCSGGDCGGDGGGGD